MNGGVKKKRGIRRWLKSTSRRTFILYPVLIVIMELVLRRGDFIIIYWSIPLLPWGYLQFQFCGKYRTRLGGGGPGLDIPPTKIVDTGIYAYTRNPMYLGHLIFMLGLTITFMSIPALLLLVFHFFWFHNRVKGDEVHLKELFGSQYEDYMIRVKRWLPGII